MYLKKIEVKGFKSFADKIELDFEKGITAVVGPNGSGKSNIADAIKWVLGEQSAKSLRGGKMEDVIFAGTQKRGALGFAEVTLVIDNADGLIDFEYSEITVKRRLYRTGESEYYINGTQCRLKDILEVFMDTGIGKDGYSLIGQGKIEEILSTRSEDRRHLFEEAAGIVKYKWRKNEAERRLENTRQNLLRVDDIIEELENQIEPLKVQSESA
ncbi:MAG: AAA family ATPase, partial [Clostridium sp.]